MISNQILQSTLDGLKAIARVELCVIDVDGKTAATTADGLEEYLPQARAFVLERLGTYITTWQTGLHVKTPLWIPLQTARRFREISFLRSMTSSSWNIF